MTDLVALGLHVAGRMGAPLRVSGRDLPVPPSLVPDLDEIAGDAESSGAAFPDSTLGEHFELARRLCAAMAEAGDAIERLGLDIGVLSPPPPEPLPSAPRASVYKRVAQEPPEPPIVERDGETVVGIGWPCAIAVRSSDNGRSWHNVGLPSTLLGWHANKAAAIAAARAAVLERWRPDQGTHLPEQFTKEQP